MSYDGSCCAFCEDREAEVEEGSDYLRRCNDALNLDKLKEEAVAMEADGILTETDDIDASNTGC